MTWQRLEVTGLAPAPRGGHAVTAVGKTLLLFGGADRAPRAYDDLWQLEIGDGNHAQWTRISAAFPASVACTARSGAALVAVGDKVYLFGGQEPNTGLCFNDVLELDTKTWTWTQLQVDGPRPPARHSCVAVAFKDQCLLIYGGAGHQGALSDVWVLNCLDRTWTNPRVQGQPPAAREMATGLMVAPNQLLIYGGRSSEGKVLDDIICLHTDNDWSWGNALATGLNRCAHTLVAVPQPQQQQQQQRESLLVFGGFSGEAVEGSLWALKQQQQQQQQTTDSRPATVSHWAAEELDAGVDMQTMMAAKASSRSSSSGGCPAPRFAHAAACLPDPQNPKHQVMIIIGGVNPLEDLMDVHVWRTLQT